MQESYYAVLYSSSAEMRDAVYNLKLKYANNIEDIHNYYVWVKIKLTNGKLLCLINEMVFDQWQRGRHYQVLSKDRVRFIL